MRSKSAQKRIVLTRNGKMKRRTMGVNHFRTSKSTKNLRKKRGDINLGYPKRKIINY